MKVAQSCPTLCDPMDYSIHGILQAKRLEWVAFPFSRGSSQPRDQTQVSHIAGGFLPAEPQGKPKMGTIKDRNSMDLTETEDIKKRWQEYTEELYKKCLDDPDQINTVV